MSAPRRVVRNFWLQALIDGRDSRLEGGPRARDGGLELSLFQRREGEVARALDVLCSVTPSGLLQVRLNLHLHSDPRIDSLTILTRR